MNFTEVEVNKMLDDTRRGNAVEVMQSKFLLRMGKMYGADPERARTTTEAVARLMMIRLEQVSIAKLLHVEAKILMNQAPKAVTAKDFKVLRKEAGDRFESIGIYNQHSPSSAVCYSIYLLAGCFHEPNMRLCVYAIADAFGWLEKAGENMEGLWAQINLLLD